MFLKKWIFFSKWKIFERPDFSKQKKFWSNFFFDVQKIWILENGFWKISGVWKNGIISGFIFQGGEVIVAHDLKVTCVGALEELGVALNEVLHGVVLLHQKVKVGFSVISLRHEVPQVVFDGGVLMSVFAESFGHGAERFETFGGIGAGFGLFVACLHESRTDGVAGSRGTFSVCFEQV